MSAWREIANQAVALILGVCAFVALVGWLVLGAPDIGAPIVEVARAVAIVSAAVIGVSVLVWGFVEDDDWSLREAIRFTSSVVLIVGLLWFIFGGYFTRLIHAVFPR